MSQPEASEALESPVNPLDATREALAAWLPTVTDPRRHGHAQRYVEFVITGINALQRDFPELRTLQPDGTTTPVDHLAALRARVAEEAHLHPQVVEDPTEIVTVRSVGQMAARAASTPTVQTAQKLHVVPESDVATTAPAPSPTRPPVVANKQQEVSSSQESESEHAPGIRPLTTWGLASVTVDGESFLAVNGRRVGAVQQECTVEVADILLRGGVQGMTRLAIKQQLEAESGQPIDMKYITQALEFIDALKRMGYNEYVGAARVPRQGMVYQLSGRIPSPQA